MIAKDILTSAVTTLRDPQHTRWPLVELLGYLNDGMREIALHKPTAVSAYVELSLVEGTLQSLEAPHISLIRVTRNLATLDADPEGRTGTTSITPVSRNSLDVVMPQWQNPEVLPFAKTVQHVIQDVADPRSFFVVPGNDGTGVIEATVSILPTPIAEPVSPEALASYTAELTQIPPIFETALTDYVIYRAFAKDATEPAYAPRAQAHYQLFAQAIGLKTASDMQANTKTTGASA